MEEQVTFYFEWLSLPKDEFNVLAMVAEQGGSYRGNYSDMCRYLGVTPQNNNRNRLQTAIPSLAAAGFITHDSRGRTQIMKVIPKATEIALPRRWVQSVIRHDYSGERVAFAQVLKVFAWVLHNKKDIVTDEMIAEDLNVSKSTVGKAKKVLVLEYENLYKKPVSAKFGEGIFHKLGQELVANAWWTEI